MNFINFNDRLMADRRLHCTVGLSNNGVDFSLFACNKKKYSPLSKTKSSDTSLRESDLTSKKRAFSPLLEFTELKKGCGLSFFRLIGIIKKKASSRCSLNSKSGECYEPAKHHQNH